MTHPNSRLDIALATDSHDVPAAACHTVPHTVPHLRPHHLPRRPLQLGRSPSPHQWPQLVQHADNVDANSMPPLDPRPTSMRMTTPRQTPAIAIFNLSIRYKVTTPAMSPPIGSFMFTVRALRPPPANYCRALTYPCLKAHHCCCPHCCCHRCC